MNVKQVIVVRKDLKMNPGKLAGQVAHASLGSLLKLFRKIRTTDNSTIYQVEFGDSSILDQWLNGIFTKVVLSVNSEEELLMIVESLEKEDIPHSLIKDSGNTVFNGVPTITCVGIGPYTNEELDKITGHLKLY